MPETFIQLIGSSLRLILCRVLAGLVLFVDASINGLLIGHDKPFAVSFTCTDNYVHTSLQIRAR